MLYLPDLLAFSHQHCVAICAFLVPLNLLLTLQTLVLVAFGRVGQWMQSLAALAIGPAILMMLHVMSWWVVGVVMAPTFVLSGLGMVCTAINLWALFHPRSLQQRMQALWVTSANLVGATFTQAWQRH